MGAALTLAALRDAREREYRIGILQSSAMAVGVYRRLGFEQYSTYLVYAGTGQELRPRGPLQTPAMFRGGHGETSCRGASCRSRRQTSGCPGGT